MTIHPNGVATIDGDQTHGVWCATEGLVHDKWFAAQITKRVFPGDVVVNAGANIGTLTKPLLDAGAEVFAFEPNPAAVECLRHNCPRAIITQAAVGNASGLAWLNIDASNAGASWLQYSDIPAGEARKDVSICLTLDSFYPLLEKQIRLILADVEGWETRLLRGAAQTIARCRPVIICEVNRGALARAGSSDSELLGLIEEMGYSIRILQPDCRIGDPQLDILCLPVKA